MTVNGVRVTVEDGTWGLVRASSNKPELVVVVESPASEARMHDMFKALDAVLRTHPEVGEPTRRSDARTIPRDGNHRFADERASTRRVVAASRRSRARPACRIWVFSIVRSCERRDRLPPACEALHGKAGGLPARGQTRAEIRFAREHLDQGGELWRDRAFAPDENRRGDIQFRWKGVNAEQLQVGERLEDDPRNHQIPMPATAQPRIA